MMRLFKSYDFIAIIGIIAFSFFAIKPLLAPGFFSMHDDTQIARVYTMAEALKDGQFPVRVVEHLGYDYGYTIFNFYAPFSYYFGAFFVLLGFSSVIATKIMIGTGVILAGIFMYLLAKEFWGKTGGVIAGIFYIYAPYHSVNVYVRGAVGEMWAYAFIPLVFYGLYKIFISYSVSTTQEVKIKNQRPKMWTSIAVAAGGYAGVILSHNLTAMMVTPFVGLVGVVFLILGIRKKEVVSVRYFLYAVFLGLGLSAFYFLPALLEMKYADVGSILGGGSDFRDHFLCPIQYWYSPWGYGGSVPGCLDGMSFQLGKPHIFFLVFTALLTPFMFIKDKFLFSVSTLVFFCLGIVLFLMVPWSKGMWEIIPPMEYFQFPWRFLVLASFCLSFLSGGIVFIERIAWVRLFPLKNVTFALVGVCLVATLGFYGKYFVPQFIVDNPEKQANPEIIRFEVSKISDEYLPKNIPQPQSIQDVPQQEIVVQKGSATFSHIEKKSNLITARSEVERPATVLFQTAFFPSWKLYLNGRPYPYTVTQGKIQTTLPRGTHDVELKFEQTLIEILGNTISLISLLVLSIGIISDRKRLSL